MTLASHRTSLRLGFSSLESWLCLPNMPSSIFSVRWALSHKPWRCRCRNKSSLIQSCFRSLSCSHGWTYSLNSVSWSFEFKAGSTWNLFTWEWCQPLNSVSGDTVITTGPRDAGESGDTGRSRPSMCVWGGGTHIFCSMCFHGEEPP